MQAIHISHTMNERPLVRGSDWVRVMCAGQKAPENKVEPNSSGEQRKFIHFPWRVYKKLEMKNLKLYFFIIVPFSLILLCCMGEKCMYANS